MLDDLLEQGAEQDRTIADLRAQNQHFKAQLDHLRQAGTSSSNAWPTGRSRGSPLLPCAHVAHTLQRQRDHEANREETEAEHIRLEQQSHAEEMKELRVQRP